MKLLLDEQATKHNVWRARSALRRQSGPQDTVWIYYAGHAAPERSDHFWVLHDADVDDLWGTGLSQKQIGEALEQIQSRRLVTFLDCCHAAATSAQKNPTRAVLTPEQLLASFAGEGRVTFNSSNGLEKSVELSDVGHGAFTFFLTRGLRGEADQRKRGVVTAEDLWTYLRGQVSDASRKAGCPQTPILGGTISHDLALTVNAIATHEKKRIGAAITAACGLGEEKLTTDQANFCLRILDGGAESDAEHDVAAAFDGLATGEMRLRFFRRIVQAAMPQLRKPADAEIPATPAPETNAASAKHDGARADGATVATGQGAPSAGAIASDQIIRAALSEIRSRAGRGLDVRKSLRDIAQKHLPELRRAARSGMKEALVLLGDCYSDGFGVSLDQTEAARLYRLAEGQGFPHAQISLAHSYAQGLGVPKNDAEAMSLLLAAASAGDPFAYFFLGVFYADGICVAVNPAESVKWLRKAAETIPLAQVALAECYMEGFGVDADEDRALDYARLAAEAGVPLMSVTPAATARPASQPARPDPIAELRTAVGQAYATGKLSEEGRAKVLKLIRDHHISNDVAKTIIEEVRQQFRQG